MEDCVMFACICVIMAGEIASSLSEKDMLAFSGPNHSHCPEACSQELKSKLEILSFMSRASSQMDELVPIFLFL